MELGKLRQADPPQIQLPTTHFVVKSQFSVQNFKLIGASLTLLTWYSQNCDRKKLIEICSNTYCKIEAQKSSKNFVIEPTRNTEKGCSSCRNVSMIFYVKSVPGQFRGTPKSSHSGWNKYNIQFSSFYFSRLTYVLRRS